MYKTTGLLLTALGLLAVSCSSSEEDKQDKRAQLQELRTRHERLGAKIDSMEAAMDAGGAASDEETTALVSVQKLQKQPFAHSIEVQGTVESDQYVQVSAESPGVVEQVLVEEGDQVKQGQILLRQDASVVSRQIEEVKTSLSHARDVFERRKNLWEKNVGSEIQYLQAKNEKERLEKQLATLRQRQNQMQVRAPFSGTVDHVRVKAGEMASPGLPLISLVNLNTLYVDADVSEKYIGDVQKGSLVELRLPSMDSSINSKVRFASQVINEANRTFRVEVDIPERLARVRPKQLAVLRIRDFYLEQALVVPTNRIQHKDNVDFVFVADQQASGQKTVARKVQVHPRMTYQGQTLLRSNTALKVGDRLVIEGFRDVEDGQPVRVVSSPDA